MDKSGVIVLLGRCKDALGFPCFLNEDTPSGQRYLSYEPEVWFERLRHIWILEALGKQVPQERAQDLAVETE